jgi:hypothetical protein
LGIKKIEILLKKLHFFFKIDLVKRSFVEFDFNKAVLFKTSDISWHGLPTPIKCPDDIGRKSIAIYYVSEPRQNATFRKKAQFRPLPYQPVNHKLQELYNIRVLRTIKEDELNSIYPNWKEDGNGYW